MPPSFVTDPVGAAPRGILGLLGDALQRRGGRRALSVLTALLTLAGVSMFAYPVVTDYFAHQKQDQLAVTVPSHFDDPQFQQAYLDHKVKVGEGLTRLTIPKIGLDVLVVEGTTHAALRAGAGHYVDTPMPCEQGNVGIAGHRTTYGRPFNRLDELGPGDLVTLQTPFAKCTYAAVNPFNGHANPWPVLPSATYVVGQQGVLGQGHWLTLTTCHPKGSASHRLILRLKMVKKQVLRSSPGPSASPTRPTDTHPSELPGS